jgi:hypothetical protein
MRGPSRAQRYSVLRRPPSPSPSPSPSATPLPLTIPGLSIWYDASASAGLVDGQTIAGLQDRSGHGRDSAVAQGSPTWSSSGFGPGHPAVLCSGRTEFSLVGSPLVLSGPCACFAVVVRPAGVEFFAVDPSSNTGLLLYSDGNVYVSDDFGHTASAAFPGSGPLVVRWLRGAGATGWVFRGTGLTSDLVLSGVPGPLTVTSFVHRPGTQDGSGLDAVAELLLFDLAVSDLSRAALESYLASKWGATL